MLHPFPLIVEVKRLLQRLVGKIVGRSGMIERIVHERRRVPSTGARHERRRAHVLLLRLAKVTHLVSARPLFCCFVVLF